MEEAIGNLWKAWSNKNSLVSTSESRLGGLTVEETALKKSAVLEEQVKRAVETRWRWKVAKASLK